MVGQLPVKRQEFDKFQQEIELFKTMLGSLKLHNEYLEKKNYELKVALDDAKKQTDSLNKRFTAGLDDAKKGLDDAKKQADSLNKRFTAGFDDVKRQTDNLNETFTTRINDTKNQADNLHKRFTVELDGIKKQVDNLNQNKNILVGSIVPFATTVAPDGWLECNGQKVSREKYSELYKKIHDTFGAGDGRTTFQLPNLQGQFVRGWDQTGEVDPNRDLGSFQSDQIQTHKHSDAGHSHGSDPHSHVLSIDPNGEHTHIAATTRNTHPEEKFAQSQGWPDGNRHTSFRTTNRDGDHVAPSAIQTNGSHSHTSVIDNVTIRITENIANIAEPIEASHGSETRPKNIALLYCIKY
ncbi:MAG: hypothetical protein N5P05_002686 [Chroococcopsis gigantea SAG 12.99]|jgi:microcystin-dependent protein/regulator of replication initiation timing|nr:tail fiber protein [Chlorogloea purpurea SAG 13.99]MDV3001080.1 hypothetical protein [Chroococcopsis gigantea SAG 12.99]